MFDDRSLWRSVDFRAVYDARTLGASSSDYFDLCSAARCVGVLETVDASPLQCRVCLRAAEQLLRLHAATLRSLRLPACGNIFGSPSPAELRRLAAAAAPALQLLEVPCEVTRVRDAIEALALPAPLRLSGLNLWLPSMGTEDRDAGSWQDFCAALSSRPLRRLSLANVDIHDEEPFAGALRAAGVRRLELREVLPGDLIDPDLAPVEPGVRGRYVSSYLRAAPLTHLLLKATYFSSRERTAYFGLEAARALASALSGAPALRSLQLLDTLLFHCPPAAAALLTACAGHPTLRFLFVFEASRTQPPGEPLDGGEAAQVGGALEALVLAPATRLRTLLLPNARLSDAAAAPLVAALPRAPRLRRLSLVGSDLSPAFCAERLLPAARAAPRLMQLTMMDDMEDEREREANPAAAEAQALALSRLRRDYDFLPFVCDADEDMLTDDEEAFAF